MVRLTDEQVSRIAEASSSASRTATPRGYPRSSPSSTEVNGNTSAMHDEVQALLRHGLWVFPCKPRSKQPATRRGFKDATDNARRAERWWADQPHANPAIDCGRSELVVVDEDQEGAFNKLCAEYGQPVPETFRVRTGGGVHHWFRQPPGDPIRNRARVDGYKVDVRGEGGYVLAPGAVHPNGGRYTSEGNSVPLELPAWLAAVLRRETKPETASEVPRRNQPPDQPSSEPVTERGARAALAAACDDIAAAAPGGRNELLNYKAYRLGRMIAAGLLNRSQVWDALSVAAKAAGLGRAEAAKTIRSGLDAAETSPRTAATEKRDERPVWERLPALDWHELWADDDAEEWIVYPLLPARRLVSLYSPPKVGKSLLALELAVAVARGTPTLGSRTERPRVVLYVDYENDPRGDVRSRLQAMSVGPDDLGNLRYLSYPVMGGLDTATGAADLLEAVDHYRPEVVVIDTISRAVDGEENSNDTWLGLYRHAGLALKQREVACLRLDHAGKDPGKGQRGGSAKAGDVDAVWRLSRLDDRENLLRLECEAARLLVEDRVLIVTRHQEPLHHTAEAPSSEAAHDRRVAALLQRLDELRVPRDAGRPTAERALRDAGVHHTTKLLSETLRLRKQPPGQEALGEW